jgi:serine protease Do
MIGGVPVPKKRYSGLLGLMAFLTLLYCSSHKTERKTLPETVPLVKASIVYVKTDSTAGTGFVVGPEGHIVTAYHIVKNAKRIEIDTRQHDQPLPCTVIAVDTTPCHHFGAGINFDTAILRVQVSGLTLPPVKLGEQTQTKEGLEMAFFGFPYGRLPWAGRFIPSVKQGLISAVLSTTVGNRFYYHFQLDGMVNPGNSGSPIFIPETGEVVGMVLSYINPIGDLANDSLTTKSGQQIAIDALAPPTGIGIGISINVAKDLLNKLP